MTNYEYLKNNKKAMIDLISGIENSVSTIEADYCERVCPHRNGSKCLCGEGCDAPYLTKIAEEWLDLERIWSNEDILKFAEKSGCDWDGDTLTIDGHRYLVDLSRGIVEEVKND